MLYEHLPIDIIQSSVYASITIPLSNTYRGLAALQHRNEKPRKQPPALQYSSEKPRKHFAYRVLVMRNWFLSIRTQVNYLKNRKMKIVNSTSIAPDVLTQLKSHVYDIIGCCQDVHRELGPWLNEYIYQEALKISLEEKQVPFVKEYYFQVSFHGHPLPHKHYMDFFCKGSVAVECKAISSIGVEQRQQLWNYMRLTNTPIGVLYNFAPVKDQCEKYYFDVNTKTISAF